jgi:hypothetical protein
MPIEPVQPQLVRDETLGFTRVRGARETNTSRTLNLIIERKNDRFRLSVQTNDPELEKALGSGEANLPLTRGDLWGIVQECRGEWRRSLIDFRDPAGNYSFQNHWDLSDNPDLKKQILGKLATAGSKLFLEIFFSARPGDPVEKKALATIGQALRAHMASKATWIRVTSDGFFAPWNLIYSDKVSLDGADVHVDGLWGYKHLVEHVPESGDGQQGIDLDESIPLNMALQLDQRIDTELNVRCNSAVMDLLAKYANQTLARTHHDYKAQLMTALRNGLLDEHILYFCCHALQEGDAAIRLDANYMMLSDDPREAVQNRISPGDLTLSIDTRTFSKHPVVFLNACGGGQINSIFYEGFATVFLGRSACAVIGPQTEVPAVFAGEFARRFFGEFFQGGPDRSIGKILHKLRCEFMDKYNNPIAVLYSVYRGGDVHLRAPVLPAAT